MNGRPADAVQWLGQIESFLEGTLTDAESERFQERLRHDDRARLMYVEYLDLHFELLQNAGRVSSPGLDVALRPRSSVMTWMAASSVAAAVLVLALTGLALNRGQSKQPAFSDSVPVTAAPPASASPEPPPVVARVCRTFQAQWTDKEFSDEAGSDLRIGDRIDLYGGAVEIEFQSGARVFLAAPTGQIGWLRIDSALACTMESGNASFQIPPSAKGFTVQTATGKYVDLGTEFGVQVDPRGPSQVHVLRGTVDASSRNDSVTLRLTRGLAATLTSASSPPTPIAFNPSVLAPSALLAQGIESARGDVHALIVMPTSLKKEAMSDLRACFMLEHRNQSLPAHWQSRSESTFSVVDGVREPAPEFQISQGARVDSYLVHARPSDKGLRRDLRGEITFLRPIVAVLTSEDDLHRSRVLFGQPATEYATETGFDLETKAREPMADRVDQVTLSADRRTLSFSLSVGNGADEFRVLVQADDPPAPVTPLTQFSRKGEQ